MKILNVSWNALADKKAKEEYKNFEGTDNDYYSTYIDAIYDFRKELYSQIEKAKGSKIHGEVVLPKEYVLNLIENLEIK